MTDDTAHVDAPVEEKEIKETSLDAKELHESSFEDIVKEAQEEKPIEKPVEEKPVETPVIAKDTTPVEEKKEEIVTPPIDPEKLKDEISDATAKKLLEQLSPADTTKAEKKDLLENAPWKKENRQPSWEEALKYLGEVNRKEVKEEILQELNAEAEKLENEEKTAQIAKESQENQTRIAWNNYWNGQLEDLEAHGKIPKVVNQTDPNDPGRVARVALFSKMNELAISAAAQKLIPNLNLKEIFYEHYTPSQTEDNNQPAGADAPVAGVGKSVTSGKGDSFSAAEIHSKSFEDILTGN